MSVTAGDLFAYGWALAILVLSPGPVVAAVVARVLARGVNAAWPIAIAVMLGDFIWLMIALFAASLIAQFEGALLAIRYLGAAYLIILGIQECRHAGAKIEAAKLANSARFWPNFLAGFLIIMSNPKAALFYVIFVPQFFDMPSLSLADLVAIGIITPIIPLVGNMIWALGAQIAAERFRSEKGRARLQVISGSALVLVGIVLVVY